MKHELREHIVAGYYCVYTDDILIFTESDDPVEHMLKLEPVLETLRTNELLVKGAKSELFSHGVGILRIQDISQGLGAYRVQDCHSGGVAGTGDGQTLALILGYGQFLQVFHSSFLRDGSTSHRFDQKFNK